MSRVLSAVVFLPIFWVIVKKFGPGPYQVLMVAAALVALVELYRLAAEQGHRCHRIVGTMVMLLLLGSFAIPRVDLEHALAFAVLALPLAALQRGGHWKTALGEIGVTFFIACFIGVPFGYLLRLRMLGPLAGGGETGSDLVFLLFFVVWASDMFALYIGSAIGRKPLAPHVSPRKTVEGAVGGLLGALLAAFVARGWFMHRLTVVDCIALGIGLGVVGILGDLVESMLKRGAGVKDSASLVPGHGGVLDRVDSLLYAAPVLYYYYVLVMRT